MNTMFSVVHGNGHTLYFDTLQEAQQEIRRAPIARLQSHQAYPSMIDDRVEITTWQYTGELGAKDYHVVRGTYKVLEIHSYTDLAAASIWG